MLSQRAESITAGDLIREISLEKDTSRDTNSKSNRTLATLEIIMVDRC